MTTDYPLEAAKHIQAQLPENFSPKTAIVLGSGLGPLVDEMEVVARFPYQDLPGFFVGNVQGHSAELILGRLNGVDIVCMKGRIHFYEGASAEDMRVPIRTLKRLGCVNVVMTNASGSFHQDVGPGSLVLVKDIMNLSGRNPLLGPNDDAYGPRFVAMENALDADLRDLFNAEAQTQKVKLNEGVYVGVLGPMYETPAEIAMYKQLGGDLVGMSTVPDIIIARHCGLKCVCIAAITNWAAGMNPVDLSHAEVLENASLATEGMIKLITNALPKL